MPDFIDIDRDGLPEEPDRFQDLPHAREMLVCHGLEAQETALRDAWASGRLHHGWIFAGPEGVGKAVLAYRFARFLLANGDPAPGPHDDLSIPAHHPVAGQVARLAHPDLAVIRRTKMKDGGSLRTEIAVDDVRDGLSIFRHTSGAGGWRIVIVDAADDLNRSSANALLKLLEEPPARALVILVASRPGTLLPTIRSRCRLLTFKPLAEEAVAKVLVSLGKADAAEAREAARGAGGSVHAALRALGSDDKELRRAAAQAIAAGGRAARELADSLAGKANALRFETFLGIIEDRLRAGIASGGEGGALAARAELWEKLRRSAREVETYNLDRRPFVLSVLSELKEIERRPR